MLRCKIPLRRRLDQFQTPQASKIRNLKMQKPKAITVPMHEGATFSWKMPDWVKLAIADSLIVFGRMEQRINSTAPIKRPSG
jgi:hypothetical protein